MPLLASEKKANSNQTYPPRRPNLHDWLKLFHEDKVGAPTFQRPKEKAEAVLGVFKLVQGAKEMGVKWKDMRYGWKGVRKMMSAVDDGWLTDEWNELS